MTAPAQAQATATDATLARLSRLADVAYLAWENAPLWRRREMWRQYVVARDAYYRQRDNGEEQAR